MNHKPLHELLKEDQEPFHLKNYIAYRRCQLKTTVTETALKPIKQKPIIQSTSARNLCINHGCLFSFHDSPDVRESPFSDFPSPAIKSPFCKSPNNATVFFHIPSRTAAILLDAATRIQKQRKPTYKSKPESSRNSGFGLFGSLFKRLKERRTRITRRETSLSSPPMTRNRGCLVDNNRVTSAVWSEKSSDLETSCSSSSVHDSEEIEFTGEIDDFCSSPFRFSLRKSPSSGCQTPDFESPATSQTNHLKQVKKAHEDDNFQEIHLEEEDKEQCSPVSVLDPLFDEEEDEGHDVEALEDNVYDLECSYANVQRAKNQLLQKLHRFEKLAKLDPIELEKHMLEQCGEPLEDEPTNGVVLSEIFKFLNVGNIPTHMKRLVSDLVAEEMKNNVEHNVVVSRVLSRFELWKMVESNTIDMMVELDFKKDRSDQGWSRYNEDEIRETGMDIEVAIFGALTEEFAPELVFTFDKLSL